MTRWFAASTLVVLAVAGAAAAKPKFVSTWKAPEAAGGAYAGKKVVGLIVSNDMQLRISAEEALARALTARGLQGVAAYIVIPREETRNPEHARAFVERAGAAAVVILRLVDLTKETTPTSVMWQSAMPYGSLWSYYPYAWGASYESFPAAPTSSWSSRCWCSTWPPIVSSGAARARRRIPRRRRRTSRASSRAPASR